MTWFVHRNPDRSLASIHQDHMPGYNDETLADSAPEIVAFLAAAVPAPTLDSNTLAAALIAKGVIVQNDLVSAVQSGAGDQIAEAVAAIPVSAQLGVSLGVKLG